jgi:hypothetical protein
MSAMTHRSMPPYIIIQQTTLRWLRFVPTCHPEARAPPPGGRPGPDVVPHERAHDPHRAAGQREAVQGAVPQLPGHAQQAPHHQQGTRPGEGRQGGPHGGQAQCDGGGEEVEQVEEGRGQAPRLQLVPVHVPPELHQQAPEQEREEGLGDELHERADEGVRVPHLVLAQRVAVLPPQPGAHQPAAGVPRQPPPPAGGAPLGAPKRARAAGAANGTNGSPARSAPGAAQADDVGQEVGAGLHGGHFWTADCIGAVVQETIGGAPSLGGGLVAHGAHGRDLLVVGGVPARGGAGGLGLLLKVGVLVGVGGKAAVAERGSRHGVVPLEARH